MASSICVICYEGFNKSTHAPSKCSFCETKICRTCLQTYLLNDISDTPKCVNPECGHGMDREFVDAHTTKSFRLHTYKQHREKVLSDRERARMPSTQEDAAEYRQSKTILKEEYENLQALKCQLARLNGQIEQTERKIYRARSVQDTFGRNRLIRTTNEVKKTEERNTFVKPCPADDCKGFLSTAWKCGLCEKWSCPDCGEVKGLNRDVEHTCDPEKVLTAQLLAKEAKSCPKCGVQICKIEGCDQMWCTVCNTGFNWRTGKIANGPVHNPHYFEYLRKQGGTPNPTGNHPGNCDAEMDRNVTRALGTYTRRSPGMIQADDAYLQEIWRLMREAQDVQINRDLRNNLPQEERYRRLRVRFMVGEVTEEEWKVALQKMEKDSHFMLAQSQVNEVFVHASRDLIRQVLDSTKQKSEIRKQVEELVAYCNTSFKAISSRFNRTIRPIVVARHRLPQQVSAPSATPTCACGTCTQCSLRSEILTTDVHDRNIVLPYV